MNFRDLTLYLHQLRPDEMAGLVVGYDMETHEGVASLPGMQGKTYEKYSMQPAFNTANPNNDFLRSPRLHIAKNGRLNTNPAHYQDYYEIVYVLEGCICCSVNGEELSLRAGTMLLMTNHVEHHMHTCGMEDIAVSIFFDDSYCTDYFIQTMGKLSAIGEIYKKQPAYPWLHVDFGVDSQTDRLGRMMLCSYFDPGSHSDLSTELLFQLFLVEADSTIGQMVQRPEEGIAAELPRIIRYIELHCSSVTLAQVAQRFGYAADYVSSAIRRRYGVSFTRYRNRLRLQQAAALLCSTNRNVTDIAVEVGFSSLSHFFKLFAEEYGVPPAEYRLCYFKQYR